MKKYIFTLIISILIAQFGFSQKRDWEQIRSEKIAFITSELKLTPDEAKIFWPVYDLYWEQKHELKKNERKLKIELKKTIENESASASKLFEDLLKIEEKQIELTRKYVVEFKKVLPEQKAYQLFLAEEKFKRHLLKKLKEGN